MYEHVLTKGHNKGSGRALIIKMAMRIVLCLTTNLFYLHLSSKSETSLCIKVKPR